MELDEIKFYILSVGDYSYFCKDLRTLAAKCARFAPTGQELELWLCSPCGGNRAAKREVSYAR